MLTIDGSRLHRFRVAFVRVTRNDRGLDRPTNVWVIDFLATERVEVAELTPSVAIGAGQLAGFHGDPADRLIVATAKSLRVPLVSKDDKIRAYSRSDKGLTVIW